MRKQRLAGVMAVALATMLTTGAMAFSHKGNCHGVRGNHAGIHGAHGGNGRRYVRDYGQHGNGAHGPSFIGFGVSGVHVGVDDGYGCSPTDKAYIGGFCGDYVPY
jgi:hypothetical protein